MFVSLVCLLAAIYFVAKQVTGATEITIGGNKLKTSVVGVTFLAGAIGFAYIGFLLLSGSPATGEDEGTTLPEAASTTAGQQDANATSSSEANNTTVTDEGTGQPTTSAATTTTSSPGAESPTGPDLAAADSLSKVGELPANGVLAVHASTERALQTTGTTALLLDVLSGEIVQTLTGHSDRVTSAAFNESGDLVATGAADGSIVIWDESQEIARLEVNTGAVEAMEFSADGSRFAASSDAPIAGAVSLYDARQWELIREIEPSGENTTDLSFSADGRDMLISTRFEGIGDLALIDAVQGDVVTSFVDDSAPLISTDISADGRTIVSGSEDGLIRFFDLLTRRGTGDQLSAHRIEDCEEFFGNCGALELVRFSPDGTVLVSGDRTGTVYVWDVEALSLIDSLDGHREPIVDIAFSHVGPELTVITVDDSRVMTWTGTE